MKNSKLVRITSLALAIAVVGGTFLAYFRVPASAAGSLNNIENIKRSKQESGLAFNIVEIAPDSESGTMGYYVAGSEPQMVKGMLSTVAKMDNASERTNYANNVILSALDARGLISEEYDAAPLRKLGAYTEYYPWDSNFYSAGHASDTEELHLSAVEKFTKNSAGQTIRGTAVPYEGGSRQGYDYKMNYDYILGHSDNIFNFEEWFNQRAYNSEAEALELDHGGSGEATFDRTGPELTIKLTQNDSTMLKPLGYRYSVNLTVGQTYTISYRVDLTADEENTSEEGASPIKSRVKILKSVDGLVFVEDRELNDEESGVFTYTFTADMARVTLLFGADGKGTVKYSGVEITKEENADYVQNVQRFVYGTPPKVYSANLFNAIDWNSNTRSQALIGRSAGDKVEFDPNDNRKITVTSDGDGSGDLLTGYSAPDAYFINAEPGATYELQYNFTKTGSGYSKVIVYPYKSGLVDGSRLTQTGGTSESFLESKKFAPASTPETVRFTVDNDTSFIKLSFGVEGASTKAEFTQVRIRKMSDDSVYYYDIAATNHFSYNGLPGHKLPPDGSVLYTKDNNGRFVYYGVFSSSGGGDIAIYDGSGRYQTYYTVDINPGTRPVAASDTKHPYYAVSDSFSSVWATNDNGELYKTKPGYFYRVDGELTYVGMANETATHKIDFNGTDTLIVNSEFVYYKGGFKNNNWFKYYTLDATEKEGTNDKYTFPISVTVIDPSDPNIVTALSTADLVVISTGLNLHSETLPSYFTDLADNETVFNLLKKRIEENKDAVVIDNRLAFESYDSVPNLQACVSGLISSVATGGVSGSLYSFNISHVAQNGAAAKTIASSNYCTEPGKINSPDSTDSPYYPVWKEIDDENGIRANLHETALQNTAVNEATCIRYILNYKNQRIYNVKEKVIVLDIEPATSNPSLTLDKLNALMPASYRYSEDNCEIVGMSVAEFVAKNEDFSENYDLIYIGASNDNMSRVLGATDEFVYDYDSNGNELKGNIVNGVLQDPYAQLVTNGQYPQLKAGDPLYNDPRMNGMYYTNVGDMIETANKEAEDFSDLQRASYVANPLNWDDMIKDLNNPPALGGMLKEDYFNWGDSLGINALKTQYIPLGGHAEVRSSGNDINKQSMERLEAYVQTGRPLIVDDRLISKGKHVNFTVHLTANDLTLEDGAYHNTFTILLKDKDGTILDTDDFNIRYHWYRRNEDNSVTDLGTTTDNKYYGLFETSGIEQDGYTTINRIRKFLGITWTESVKVAKYKTAAKGLGVYYCQIAFTYHGEEFSGKSNEVKVQMKPDIEKFVSRLYSDSYWTTKKGGFLSLWGDYTWKDFQNATYEVKFFRVDETKDSDQWVECTQDIQNKFNVQYEWWDEQYDQTVKVKCAGNGFWHTTKTREFDVPRVLNHSSEYENFNSKNYEYQTFSWYCSDCPGTFSNSISGTGLTDVSQGGRVLNSTGCNRVICRLTFTVGGKPTHFKAAKAGWAYSEVFVSKTTGNWKTGEVHDDNGTYPFAELYSATFHATDRNMEFNFKGRNANQDDDTDKNDQRTNCPEYEFQISEIDTHPVPSDPVYIRMDTDSELKVVNIDNCSYMWRFLVGNYYNHRSNMFAYDDGLSDVNNSGNTSKLAKALSTPRPEIKNIKTNSEYAIRDYGDEGYRHALSRTIEDGKSVLSEDLTITFDIEEPTETFSGKYKAEVYLDSDGDGKFDEGELYSLSALSNLSPNSTNNTITVQLNPESKGIVPWKLLVTEENPPAGRGATHMSRTGYAYAKPDEDDPIKINAAMVLPGAWDPAEWVRPTSGRAYDFNKSYLNIQSEVAGPKRTIDVLGKPKQIENNYWSENEYMGPVFASPVFDQLRNDPYATTVRMTQEDFENEGITIVEWDGVGGVDDGNNPLKQPLYHLGFKINGSDIQIMITCLSLHMLNTFYGITSDDGFGAMTWKCDNAECTHKNENITGMYCTYCGSAKKKVGNQSDILQSYNMLILGFADSWGKLASSFLDIAGNQVEYLEGMSNYTALGIKNYLDLDLPVLFCHDTTNRSVDFLDLYIDKLKEFGTTIWSNIGEFVNRGVEFLNWLFDVTIGRIIQKDDELIRWRMDTSDERLKNTKIQQGYWNNIVLRDSLGLDRYGITSAIISRSEAIVNDERAGETGLIEGEKKDPYDNAPLGRAHMYNYLYNGYSSEGDFTSQDEFISNDDKFITINHTRDLTIKHFIETDHSVAWVPGTAKVYGRNPEDESKVDHVVNGVTVYENQPITDANGIIHAEFDRYTQGFTDYTIARYANPNNTTQFFPTAATERFDRSTLRDDGVYQKTFTTNKVTQVNGGKKTFYPYDLNCEDNDGVIDGFQHYIDDMNSTQDIYTTHEQVYQCNMNGDDITVWFALYGGDFGTYNETTKRYTGKRNDAANAYFIYSRGNVTYTGAGHKNQFTVWEAKLFLDVIVSSYMPEKHTPASVRYVEDPSSKIVDDENNAAINATELGNARYILLVPDVDEDGDTVLVPERNAFVLIDDSETGTANTNLIYELKFTYTDDNNNEVDITNKVSLFRVSGDNKIPAPNKDNLSKQTLYTFAIPQDILNLFYNDDGTLNSRVSESIKCTVIKSIKKGNNPKEEINRGNDDLVISRIQLFDPV